MEDLVKFLIKELADTDDVTVVETEKGHNVIDMDIFMNKSEVGKIIGKQGRIAKALRTVIKAAAAKENKKYNIVIKERAQKTEPAAEIKEAE
ncbi:MAG: KH domain-containing protein [Clostridiales bacterium]|jgi:predicted RNA-binding protein YlqC (UPF0109 family)|nr:KH domain-containing protein [Clostridiales bacterium]